MSNNLVLQDLDLSGKIVVCRQTHWGNFSDVWHGKLLIDVGETDIAIKALRLHQSHISSSKMSVEERLQKRFIREVLLWRRLQHPNIVPLLGYTLHHNGLPTLISWYANGNLIEYLEHNSEVNRQPLVEDVTRALQYLHSIPAVHGDIKGENVLVDSTGSASLCDFGMSKFLNELQITGFTTSNANGGGTDRYLCPELLDDEPKTTVSDIWAFACLIVLILTDQTPYHEITKRHLLPAAILRGDPPYLNHGGAIDGVLWSCLMRCWSLCPETRPDISELASHIFPLSVAKTLKTPSLFHTLDGHGNRVCSTQFSPDGNYLSVAHIGSGGLPGASIELWQVGTGVCTLRHYIPHTIRMSLAWSPSGEHLLLVCDERVIILDSKSGRETSDIYCIRVADIVAWLPSGTKIARGGCKNLYIFDIHGHITATFLLPSTKVRQIAFASDSICVLLQKESLQTEESILVFNMETTQVESRLTFQPSLNAIMLSKDGRWVLMTDYGPPELWKIQLDQSKHHRLSFVHAYGSDKGFLGNTIFGGCKDKLVIHTSSCGVAHVWDRDSAAHLHTIKLWPDALWPDTGLYGVLSPACAWNDASTEKAMFATWRSGSTVKIWSTLAPSLRLTADSSITVPSIS